MKIIILLSLSITFCYAPVFAQDQTQDSSIQAESPTSDIETMPSITADDTISNGNAAPADGSGGLKEKFTVDNLLNWWTLATAALMSLVTFLTGLFPNFVFIKDDRKRDLALKSLAAALLVGATMVVLGGASGWEVAVGFLLSVFGYDKVLNPIGLKTKTSAESKQ